MTTTDTDILFLNSQIIIKNNCKNDEEIFNAFQNSEDYVKLINWILYIKDSTPPPPFLNTEKSDYKYLFLKDELDETEAKDLLLLPKEGKYDLGNAISLDCNKDSACREKFRRSKAFKNFISWMRSNGKDNTKRPPFYDLKNNKPLPREITKFPENIKNDYVSPNGPYIIPPGNSPNPKRPEGGPVPLGPEDEQEPQPSNEEFPKVTIGPIPTPVGPDSIPKLPDTSDDPRATDNEREGEGEREGSPTPQQPTPQQPTPQIPSNEELPKDTIGPRPTPVGPDSKPQLPPDTSDDPRATDNEREGEDKDKDKDQRSTNDRPDNPVPNETGKKKEQVNPTQPDNDQRTKYDIVNNQELGSEIDQTISSNTRVFRDLKLINDTVDSITSDESRHTIRNSKSILQDAEDKKISTEKKLKDTSIHKLNEIFHMLIEDSMEKDNSVNGHDIMQAFNTFDEFYDNMKINEEDTKEGKSYVYRGGGEDVEKMETLETSINNDYENYLTNMKNDKEFNIVGFRYAYKKLMNHFIYYIITYNTVKNSYFIKKIQNITNTENYHTNKSKIDGAFAQENSNIGNNLDEYLNECFNIFPQNRKLGAIYQLITSARPVNNILDENSNVPSSLIYNKSLLESLIEIETMLKHSDNHKNIIDIDTINNIIYKYLSTRFTTLYNEKINVQQTGGNLPITDCEFDIKYILTFYCIIKILTMHFESQKQFIFGSNGNNGLLHKENILRHLEEYAESDVISYVKIRDNKDNGYNPRYVYYTDKSGPSNNSFLSQDNETLSLLYCNNPIEPINYKDKYTTELDAKDYIKYDHLFHYGYFDKIIYNKDNRMFGDEMTKVKDKLQNGKDVFIIGYGASGAGKTTTLIYDKNDEKNSNGAIVYMLQSLATAQSKKYDFKKLKLNIIEMFLDDSDIGKIKKVNKLYSEIKPVEIIKKTLDKVEQEPAPEPKDSLDFIYNNDIRDFVVEPAITLPDMINYLNSLNDADGIDAITKEAKNYINKYNSGKLPLSVILQLLIDEKRKISATSNNPQSSRSHVIAIIEFNTIDNTDESVKLMVGDFAGVENKFDYTFDKLISRETISDLITNINKHFQRKFPLDLKDTNDILTLNQINSIMENLYTNKIISQSIYELSNIIKSGYVENKSESENDDNKYFYQLKSAAKDWKDWNSIDSIVMTNMVKYLNTIYNEKYNFDLTDLEFDSSSQNFKVDIQHDDNLTNKFFTMKYKDKLIVETPEQLNTLNSIEFLFKDFQHNDNPLTFEFPCRNDKNKIISGKVDSINFSFFPVAEAAGRSPFTKTGSSLYTFLTLDVSEWINEGMAGTVQYYVYADSYGTVKTEDFYTFLKNGKFNLSFNIDNEKNPIEVDVTLDLDQQKFQTLKNEFLAAARAALRPPAGAPDQLKKRRQVLIDRVSNFFDILIKSPDVWIDKLQKRIKTTINGRFNYKFKELTQRSINYKVKDAYTQYMKNEDEIATTKIQQGQYNKFTMQILNRIIHIHYELIKRTYEGVFINGSLESMRSTMTNVLKQKNTSDENTSDNSNLIPKFNSKCINYYGTALDDKIFESKSSNSSSNNFNTIHEVLADPKSKNEISLTEEQIKNLASKLIYCVCLVLNNSYVDHQNIKVNNPPKIPYIDLTEGYIELNRYQTRNRPPTDTNSSDYHKQIIYKMYNIGIKRNNVNKVDGKVLERDKLLTQHVIDYISNNEGYEYEKLTNEKINDKIYHDIYEYTDFCYQAAKKNKTIASSKLDTIKEKYEKLIQLNENESTNKDKLVSAIINFLNEIEVMNATSVVGTLDFADQMSKYDLKFNACSVVQNNIKYAVNNNNTSYNYNYNFLNYFKTGGSGKYGAWVYSSFSKYMETQWKELIKPSILSLGKKGDNNIIQTLYENRQPVIMSTGGGNNATRGRKRANREVGNKKNENRSKKKPILKLRTPKKVEKKYKQSLKNKNKNKK